MYTPCPKLRDEEYYVHIFNKFKCICNFWQAMSCRYYETASTMDVHGTDAN